MMRATQNAVDRAALAEDAPELPPDPQAEEWQRQAASGACDVPDEAWPTVVPGSLPETGVDALTVLTAVDGQLATKRIVATWEGWDIEPYGRAKRFRVDQIGVNNITSLHAALDRLSHANKSFAIRGEPLPDTDLKNTLRRKHDRPEKGEVATFAPRARRWILLDLDDAPLPAWGESANAEPLDPISDADLVVRTITSALLPPEFAGMTCVWQQTSSAGLSPGAVRVRLGFWLERPVSDDEAKRWFARYPVVDQALFDPIQAHYTAAPIVSPTELDPVTQRLGICWGHSNIVAVPDLSPPPRRPRPRRQSLDACRGGGDINRRVVAYRNRMVEAVANAFPGQRHAELKKAAAVGFSMAFAGLDDPDEVECALVDAVAECCPKHDDRRRKADLIAWCRERAKSNPSIPKVFEGEIQ